MARFWWGNSDASRKVHWKSWATMCTLKCFGGMGFKDPTVFNDALLGRQAWRLIRHPTSLFGRVMKAKYFPTSDFLTAPLGYSCSYSWKSIWSSKALIKEGSMWRIRCGSQVSIWDDPWLIGDNGRFITSEKRMDLRVVKDLIDPTTMEWNCPLIEASFNAHDARCILAIPLSTKVSNDELVWTLTKTSDYSVKTAYMLGKGGNLDSFHQAWVNGWGAEDSPKVRNFLWRLCTSSLPVRDLLHYRHFIEDASCPWGCGECETATHAIFGCPRLSALWEDCGCDVMRVLGLQQSMCEVMVAWQAIDVKVRKKGFALAWVIWGERNNWVFNKKATPTRSL